MEEVKSPPQKGGNPVDNDNELELNEDWLDDELLADDDSAKNWRINALGGKTTAEALMHIPKQAQINIRIPMVVHRAVRLHTELHGSNPGRYMKEALGMRLRDEGFSPEHLKYFFK